MITVLIHHKVSDFNTWKPVFDSTFQFRHSMGEDGYKLFRSLTDPHDVTLMLSFFSAEAAEKFVNSDALTQRMKEAGVIGEPTVRILGEVLMARRTAAD